MYSFLAIIVVVVLAMGVYAYNSVPANPSVFGHTSDEINFTLNTVPVGSVNATLCEQTNGGSWLNCPIQQDYQTDLGLYINGSGYLCYPTPQATSCTAQSTTCSAPNVTLSGVRQQLAPGKTACNAPLLIDTYCQGLCGAYVACSGDQTQFNCGGTDLNYAFNSIVSCTPDNANGVDQISCACTGTGTYQLEVADSVRCI